MNYNVFSMLLLLILYPISLTLVYLVYLNFLKNSSNVVSKNEDNIFHIKTYNYVNLNFFTVYLCIYMFALSSNININNSYYFNSLVPFNFIKMILISFVLVNALFRSDFNVQFGLKFILLSLIFSYIFNDFLITIVLFEVVFYMYLYTLIFSLFYSTSGLKSHNISSLLFPLIILNFYSTWLFFGFSLFCLYELGCTSCDYILFSSNFVKFFYFIVVLFKVNIGPWFFKLLPLYRFLSKKSILVYIFIYFFCILPSLYMYVPINFSYAQFLPVIFIFYYLHFFDFFLIKSVKYILLYSSFVTYYYVLFLFLN